MMKKWWNGFILILNITAVIGLSVLLSKGDVNWVRILLLIINAGAIGIAYGRFTGKRGY